MLFESSLGGSVVSSRMHFGLHESGRSRGSGKKRLGLLPRM
jgi:hypothetical protein